MTAKNNRKLCQYCYWTFKTGAPWRDLPERYGDWKNVHRRFSGWATSGVDRIFRVLSEDADMEFLTMDGSKIHIKRTALPKKNNHDEGLGRSSGVLSSKIHVLADGLGNPVDFILTEDEVS